MNWKFRNHREYITSVEWLKKKSELVSIYNQLEFPIDCYFCRSNHNLHVHHLDYKEFGNENISRKNSEMGRGIWQFMFLCDKCHKDWHYNPSALIPIEQKHMPMFMELFVRSKENQHG